MNGADLNDVPGLRRMDHLAAANVDPAVSRLMQTSPGCGLLTLGQVIKSDVDHL